MLYACFPIFNLEYHFGIITKYDSRHRETACIYSYQHYQRTCQTALAVYKLVNCITQYTGDKGQQEASYRNTNRI